MTDGRPTYSTVEWKDLTEEERECFSKAKFLAELARHRASKETKKAKGRQKADYARGSVKADGIPNVDKSAGEQLSFSGWSVSVRQSDKH